MRCRETGGRQFIVEMQMNWRSNYEQRALFNAAKAELEVVQTERDAATAERDAAVQKLHQTVRQMKANGLTADVIAKFTGMTSAEIERIC